MPLRWRGCGDEVLSGGPSASCNLIHEIIRRLGCCCETFCGHERASGVPLSKCSSVCCGTSCGGGVVSDMVLFVPRNPNKMWLNLTSFLSHGCGKKLGKLGQFKFWNVISYGLNILSVTADDATFSADFQHIFDRLLMLRRFPSQNLLIEIDSLSVDADFSLFEKLNMDYFRKSKGLLERCICDSAIDKRSVHDVVHARGLTRIDIA